MHVYTMFWKNGSLILLWFSSIVDKLKLLRYNRQYCSMICKHQNCTKEYPRVLLFYFFKFYLQTVTTTFSLTPGEHWLDSNWLSSTHPLDMNIMEPASSLRLASASSVKLGRYSLRVTQWWWSDEGHGEGAGGDSRHLTLSLELHWLQCSPDAEKKF